MIGASLIAAALLTSAASNAATTTRTADCLSVPKGFSSLAVKAAAAPASLWKGWIYGDDIKMTVAPHDALFDQPVAVRVHGLKPGQPLTLKASATDRQGRTWSASAIFVADTHGEIDAGRMAPQYGDYSGVHAMGLVWAMKPEGVKNPAYALFIPKDHHIEFAALARGKLLAQATLTRSHVAPNVRHIQVNTDGLVGDLFLPTTPGKHPGIVVLGGSEGGLHPQVEEAALLAAHGYAALGLAYFQGGMGIRTKNPRLAGLPKMLVEIPLEYFVKAADWLKQQPGVDAHEVAIMGWSKGAEAALVTAALFPRDFQAVLAYAPSSVAWFGLQYRGPATSSWTLDGNPLPWATPIVDPALFTGGKPISFTPGYAAGLEDTAAVSKAAIPVERIAGPVLLISGTDDQMWPSAVMARQIMQRLAAHDHAYADESLCYRGAGHMILPPYRPTVTTGVTAGPMTILLGGSQIAYAFANPDSWHKVLRFLQTALQETP
ncbi:MAG: acyl-CoA thioesterase/BAAT N-terminal domain-containing protein [Gammaproteobacteria bacterium]|nr:acyl-CoA thioesterase/BAAT N-terminal domain-containing protein [Gammaproteobacteria bacterium]